MKNLIIRTVAAAALLTTTAAVLATTTQDGKGRYAEVNGLKMYYEIHGFARISTDQKRMHRFGSVSSILIWRYL